jgi:hypothetical protein
MALMANGEPRVQVRVLESNSGTNLAKKEIRNYKKKQMVCYEITQSRRDKEKIRRHDESLNHYEIDNYRHLVLKRER